MNQIYLLAILFSLIVGFVMEFSVVRMAYRKKIFDKPNSRKLHSEPIPRLGGIIFAPVIFIVLVLLIIWDYPDGKFSIAASDGVGSMLSLLGAGGVMFAFGVVDDFLGLRYRTKFIGQIIAGFILCGMGCYIDNLHGLFGLHELSTPVGWILTVFAVIYVTNAINFVDGIDGLASGLCAIALTYDAVAFYITDMMLFSVMSVVALVVLIPFMIMNLYGTSKGRTKTFMGDTGSLFLGLFLVYLGIMLNSPVSNYHLDYNQFVFAFVPLTLPCYDVLRVVAHRVRNGQSPFLADKNHIHHKLLALGLSQQPIRWILLLTSVLMTIVLLWCTKYIDSTIVLVCSIALWLAANYLLTMKMKNKNKPL